MTMTRFWFILFLLFEGCAPYKIPTSSFLASPCVCPTINTTSSLQDATPSPQKQAALSHWLYRYIPRHRSQIKAYDIGHWITWTLLGNDDDGIFGEEKTADYHPEQPISVTKAISWGLRNPLHNFCFYVIGSAQRKNSEWTLLKLTKKGMSIGNYSEEAATVFADEGTSFFAGLHGGKPFLSLRLCYFSNYHSDFYIGWRCRGNFGLKLNLLTKRPTQNPEDFREENEL
ncbi:hypothetical protein [Parachlamydia sp. AcF125]|uniref:hypothetical protein n=1 Tax=Parachlamydia sp. AcF125 TaxID=2795736 RepID=UPI001BD81686|nr:hypothetical protein [Parachlamydia sp. AcF125]MBS4167652.1 hypothetical protein [Parachlamydia sp. AcF125]